MCPPAVPGRDYPWSTAEWLEEDVCLYLMLFTLEFGFLAWFIFIISFLTEIWDLFVL